MTRLLPGRTPRPRGQTTCARRTPRGAAPAQPVRCVDGPQRTEAAVGRRGAAETDDDPPRARVECEVDQLAGARRRRPARASFPSAPPTSASPGREPPRSPPCAVEAPLGLDRVAERAGDHRRRFAPPSASSVPSPPSATGSSTQSCPASQHVWPIAAAAWPRGGPAELVDRRQDSHATDGVRTPTACACSAPGGRPRRIACHGRCLDTIRALPSGWGDL